MGESSDKLGSIVGNQDESSDRRATIGFRSGLSFTADGNLYCSFLLKNGLLSCKTSDLGNLSEDSPMKNLGESSDTEAVHAHFCPNIEPIYQQLVKSTKSEQVLRYSVSSTTIERLRYRSRGVFQCSKVVNSDGQRAYMLHFTSALRPG